MKKIAYIASPVAFFFISRTEKQGERVAKTYAKRLSEEAKKMGFIPVSCPIMFLGLYNESVEREQALDDSLSVMKKCDVFFYKKDDVAKSRGIQNELKVAKEIGMEIVEI